MSAHFYGQDARQPFDSAAVRDTLHGCLLCSSRHIAVVGVFRPSDATARSAVLKLRRHVVPPGTAIALAYGLCGGHDVAKVATDVEARILALAEGVGRNDL